MLRLELEDFLQMLGPQSLPLCTNCFELLKNVTIYDFFSLKLHGDPLKIELKIFVKKKFKAATQISESYYNFKYGLSIIMSKVNQKISLTKT